MFSKILSLYIVFFSTKSHGKHKTLYSMMKTNMTNESNRQVERIRTPIRNIRRRERRIPNRLVCMDLLPSGSYTRNGTVFLDGECLGTIHEVVNKQLGGL